MGSPVYALNEKVLFLIYKFGNTFTSLFDFVSNMLSKEDEFSMDLKETI